MQKRPAVSAPAPFRFRSVDCPDRETARMASNQSAATRLLRRLILRAAVFLWSTPRATPRAISGCASFSACCGGLLVAAGDGRFDLLDEAADAADARTVDLGAAVVATDALLGLRRIGHIRSVSRSARAAGTRPDCIVVGRKRVSAAHGPSAGKRAHIVRRARRRSSDSASLLARRADTTCCARPARCAGSCRRHRGGTARPRGHRRRSGWRNSPARHRAGHSRARSSRRRDRFARAPRGSPAPAARARRARPRPPALRGWMPRAPQRLADIDIAEPGDDPLVEQQQLDRLLAPWSAALR